MKDELILIQDLIHEIRGKKVMLDFDLARLYQVETKALKQAVRRNLDRFPDDFMFTLSTEEYNSLKISLRSQIVTSNEALKRNEYTEDVRHDIDNLYMAIGELSARIEEKKNEPRPRIGFK